MADLRYTAKRRDAFSWLVIDNIDSHHIPFYLKNISDASILDKKEYQTTQGVTIFYPSCQLLIELLSLPLQNPIPLRPASFRRPPKRSGALADPRSAARPCQGRRQTLALANGHLGFLVYWGGTIATIPLSSS